jgi:hypothetical protein
MEVSVPQQPTTSTLRIFFFLYVCFCFAISRVFQAFFVSYLVEPNYEKKLETLDELLVSGIVYGSHSFFTFAQDTFSYPELVQFLEHKNLQDDCSGPPKCVERTIAKRGIASFIAPFFATYVARDLGLDGGKTIRSLNEAGMSGV